MNKRQNPLNSIEICAGAGGMTLGLKKAGFRHNLLIDYDKDAIRTLKENFNMKIWHKDVSTIKEEEIVNYKNVTLLAAGLPCQPFSYSGKKKGFDDTRGTVFHDYIRIVKIVKPEIILIENVRGLFTHDNGLTFKIIKNTIEENGYYFKYKLLNANDYGVPQKRIRIFILGFKRKRDFDNFKWPKKEEYKPVLRDVIYGLPNNMEGSQYNKRKKTIFEMVPPGGNWKSLPIEVAKEYMKRSYYLGGGKTGIARRMAFDEPSLTLTTSPQQNQTERCHPEYTRPFSIKEYARIQTFPDDYKFVGSTSSKYKQIGNAVPVELAKKIGEAIVKSID